MENLKKVLGEADFEKYTGIVESQHKYNNEVVSIVDRVYGEDSKVFEAMISGENISGLVRRDVKKNPDGELAPVKQRLLKLAEACESRAQENE